MHTEEESIQHSCWYLLSKGTRKRRVRERRKGRGGMCCICFDMNYCFVCYRYIEGEEGEGE